MKNALLILLFAASALAQDAAKIEKRIDEIRYQAFSKRYEANSKADREYRAAIATTLQFADRAEVYLLDFSIGKDFAYKPKDEDKVFPIRPYKSETKILKTATVPAKELPAWRAAVTKMVTSDKEGGGAFCHYPIHGLRIYAGTKLLFETSICWACRNYYFDYDGQHEWVSLTDDSDDLSKLLHDFMPIPEAEMKRFPK